MLVLWMGMYVGRGLWSLQQQIHTEEDQRFEVLKGESFQGIALRMRDKGLIEDPRWLILYARITDKAKRIKTGKFVIPVGLNQIQWLDYLLEGEVIQDSIQFIEGTSYKDALVRLKAHPEVSYDLPESDSDLMGFLGLSGHPEGQFFPDTYQFDAGSRASEILKRAHSRLQEKLIELWQEKQKALPLRSSYEVLILASIIEKETGEPSERGKIAGVFINRLKKNMRLETDPTVIYGLGEAYQGNLTREHLRSWTAYNTYRIQGLPPSPIALVGAEALIAATQPESTDALYFVAKGDGSHHFSSTYDEHRRAVARYQVYRRKQDYRTDPK